MGNQAVSGYTDIVGKHGLWIGDHTGPSSYVTGGESIGNANAPGSFGLRSLDLVAAEALSHSGNYAVEVLSPIGSGGSAQTRNLKWFYSPTNSLNPSVPVGVPLGLGTLSAAATQSTYTSSGLLTVVGANTLSPGQFIVFSNGASGAGIFLNGVMAQVVTASATGYTCNFGQGLALAYTIATDTLKYQVVQASSGNLLQAQALAAPITGVLATAILLTVTQANSLVVGQFVALSGTFKAASLYASGAIVQITSASSTGWTAKWQGTIIAQTSSEVGVSSLLVTNGGAPVVASQSAFGAITNTLAVAAAATAAGLLTLTSIQNMQAGNLIVVQGVGVNTTLNGTIATVIAASLTNIVIKANGWTVIENTQAETVGTASVLVTGYPVGTGEVTAGTNLSGETVRLMVLGG